MRRHNEYKLAFITSLGSPLNSFFYFFRPYHACFEMLNIKPDLMSPVYEIIPEFPDERSILILPPISKKYPKRRAFLFRREFMFRHKFLFMREFLFKHEFIFRRELPFRRVFIFRCEFLFKHEFMFRREFMFAIPAQENPMLPEEYDIC